MTATHFVDTNVLVYARDASEPDKQRRAAQWMELLWRERAGRISAQVLGEYYVTLTAKLDPGLGRAAARRDVERLATWRPVPIDDGLVSSALGEQERYGFFYWDSLIVAAARASGAEILLSEDLQHGQKLDGLEVVDPFKQEPPKG
jgi:predicted nucleic acid-binding protein